MKLIRTFGALAIATVALVPMACAGAPEQMMAASGQNTAGEGTVRAKAGANGNTDLEVSVKHLADPSRLAQDTTVYVVWVKPRAGQVQNVGALRVDEDLTGKLTTTTPHREFTLTVTPEASATVATPSHPPVFTTDVVRGD